MTAYRRPTSEVPQGWKQARLGDVADIAFSSVDKKTVQGEEPVRLCNYTDVYYKRRIVPTSDFMVATATPTEISKWRLKKDDVLFTKDSETSNDIGIPSYVTDNMPDVLCGYHLGRARPDPTIVDGDFLAHAMGSHAVAKEFSRIANGITRFGLTLAGVRSLRLALPPLPEQGAITSVLDSIDETIERTEAVITATEQLRESVREELLTRGLPGWHSDGKSVPGIGVIPTEWKVDRLREVTEINCAQWNQEGGSSILYLDLTSVVAPGRLSPPKKLSVQEAPSRARRMVRSGDILVSTVRPNLRGFARVARAEENLIASTGFAVLTPSPLVNGSFIYHLVMANSFSRHLANAATGQAYPACRPADVGAFLVALPPLPEQAAIARVLDSLDDTIETSITTRDTLTNVKVSTAEALLTGRRRVAVGMGV